MEVALAVAVTAVVLAGCALVLVRTANGPKLTGATVVVYLKPPDDRTLRGTVHARRADEFSLVGASVVFPGGREQALGGVQHIPIGAIGWIQEVQATS